MGNTNISAFIRNVLGVCAFVAGARSCARLLTTRVWQARGRERRSGVRAMEKAGLKSPRTFASQCGARLP